MENPIVAVDSGLFSTGDVTVVDENHKFTIVKNGSKLCVV